MRLGDAVLDQAVKETQLATAQVQLLHKKVSNNTAKAMDLETAVADLKDKVARLKMLKGQTLSGLDFSGGTSWMSYGLVVLVSIFVLSKIGIIKIF